MLDYVQRVWRRPISPQHGTNQAGSTLELQRPELPYVAPALAGRSLTSLDAGKRRDFCQLSSATGASRRLGKPWSASSCTGTRCFEPGVGARAFCLSHPFAPILLLLRRHDRNRDRWPETSLPGPHPAASVSCGAARSDLFFRSCHWQMGFLACVAWLDDCLILRLSCSRRTGGLRGSPSCRTTLGSG